MTRTSVAAKKAAPKKATAKKAAPKRTTTSRARTTAKKPAAKKVPAKKTPAKKPAAAKTKAPAKRPAKKLATKKATTKTATKKKPATKSVVRREVAAPAPEVIVPEQAASMRKAPTPLQDEKLTTRRNRIRLVVAGVLVFVGVGASAAVGLTDQGRIDINQKIAERNARIQAGQATSEDLERSESTLISQNTNQAPDGGLIGLVDTPAPAPAPLASSSIASSTATSSVASSTASSTIDSDVVASTTTPAVGDTLAATARPVDLPVASSTEPAAIISDGDDL